MKYNFKGKKLLILGGMKMACDLVRRAKEMGAYVVVADLDLKSPAKQIADKAIYIDATNVEALIKLCKEEKIDGVTTGYVDLLLPFCRELSEKINIPYYASEKMIDVSTNKESFKEMCKKYNLPYPKSFEIKGDNLEEESKRIIYPVFVKPMDASGSRGAAVCNDSNDFLVNYKVAKSFSKNSKVIVEEYLTGTDFILDYILVDGEPLLLSMFDRMVCSNRPSAVNHANMLISPSKALNLYLEDINKRVIHAFKDMNFKDGLIFLQGYWNENKVTFFEMGCRLGGTFPEIDEYFTGLNPMKLLVNYALSGKMIDIRYENKIDPQFEGIGVAINLLTNRSHAIVSKIDGLEIIKKNPNVLNCIQYLHEGEEYDLGTQTDKPVAILYLATKNIIEMKEIVKEIYSIITVLDENGNNLLMPFYPESILDTYIMEKGND